MVSHSARVPVRSGFGIRRHLPPQFIVGVILVEPLSLALRLCRQNQSNIRNIRKGPQKKRVFTNKTLCQELEYAKCATVFPA